MRHKILLTILGAVLMVLFTSQCKCGNQSVYDTIDVDLQWEEPQSIDLVGLDLKTAKGFSCRVPSENATYFINAIDGKAYRFAQEGGALKCQASGNVAPFNLKEAFIFAAGSMQNQSLHFGTVSSNQIIINQLEEGSWKQVIKQNLSIYGSNVQKDKFVAASTLKLDGQQQGCIMFIQQKGGGPKCELGCLLFDPAKKNLVNVNVDASYSHGISPNTYLIGGIGINSGKVLLGKGYYKAQNKDNYDILQIEADTLRLLSKDFKNNSFTRLIKDNDLQTGKVRWELFSMLDTGIDPHISVPIFVLVDDNTHHFFRLTSKSDLEQLTLPSLDGTNKPSLVIPLGDKVGLISTRLKPVSSEEEDAEEQEESIYYQAQLNKSNPKLK